MFIMAEKVSEETAFITVTILRVTFQKEAYDWFWNIYYQTVNAQRKYKKHNIENKYTEKHDILYKLRWLY